jgi:prepilin-type N-terminal cleavage/methylation domain-containing protein
MMYQKKQKGFTLLELMIVVVILAILAAGGTVAYNTSKAEALAASKAGISAKVEAVLAMHLAANNAVPPSNTNLAASLPDGTATTDGVTFVVDDVTILVPTYTAIDCTTSAGSTSTTDIVCVGNMS